MVSLAYQTEKQTPSVKNMASLNSKHSCLCRWGHLCYKICWEQAAFLFCTSLTP